MQDQEYADLVTEWQNRPEWGREMNWLISPEGANLVRRPTVLDIGCHTGRFMRMMGRAGCVIVVGVEPNKVARKQKLVNRLIYANLDTIIKLGNEAFTDVTLVHVLPHVDDPVKLTSQIKAVTQPGSRVVVHGINPNYAWWMRPYNWLTGYKSDPTFLRYWSSDDIWKLFEPHWQKMDMEVKYWGEKPKWLPGWLTPHSARLRMCVIITLG